MITSLSVLADSLSIPTPFPYHPNPVRCDPGGCPPVTPGGRITESPNWGPSIHESWDRLMTFETREETWWWKRSIRFMLYHVEINAWNPPMVVTSYLAVSRSLIKHKNWSTQRQPPLNTSMNRLQTSPWVGSICCNDLHQLVRCNQEAKRWWKRVRLLKGFGGGGQITMSYIVKNDDLDKRKKNASLPYCPN